jgi:hypothetical protein
MIFQDVRDRSSISKEKLNAFPRDLRWNGIFASPPAPCIRIMSGAGAARTDAGL